MSDEEEASLAIELEAAEPTTSEDSSSSDDEFSISEEESHFTDDDNDDDFDLEEEEEVKPKNKKKAASAPRNATTKKSAAKVKASVPPLQKIEGKRAGKTVARLTCANKTISNKRVPVVTPLSTTTPPSAGMTTVPPAQMPMMLKTYEAKQMKRLPLVRHQELEKKIELKTTYEKPNIIEKSGWDSKRSPQDEERRRENIKALVNGCLETHRKSMLPKLLSVHDEAAVVLRRPFKSPLPNAPSQSESLKKALMMRRQFVPWGAGKPFLPVKMKVPENQMISNQVEPKHEVPTAKIELPPGADPLVLWESSDGTSCIKVDNALTRFLRPHQREGVQFMFECVCGLRKFEGQGCILADDMGLGKTLQGITLLWTLLNSGHEELGSEILAKRIVICCPTSLVSNWDSECSKWLNGRVTTIPLCESSREDVIASINQFLSPSRPAQLLIVSYETFRLHADRFQAEGSCDLLICDEAHRLKNDQTLTNKALDSLPCKRRVLLSGTPMQNQLQEFYAMVNFCNPGVLGTPSNFRKQFENPILAGREPDASDEEKDLGQERSEKLSQLVNEFILRRTNNLLSAHLPPKVVEIVCCAMTPLQYELYTHFLHSRSVRSLFSSQKAAGALSAITSLRKLLNHPKLIHDMIQASDRSGSNEAKGFEGCSELFQEGMFDPPRGSRGCLPEGWENYSGKFAVVARMLSILRSQTKDRVVIVSNFTQTLDLFTLLCRERKYPYLRLDGSISTSKRQKLVKKFNDPKENEFVFLLSSKAGGCGLNLIGGNRLILFDMSWNPADDKQAAARVWRDGQQRRVYVYKFMTTGTIEEKIFQRQLSKEGLQSVVDSESGAAAGSNMMSFDQLRDLFSYDPETLSTTYDHMVGGGKLTHGDELFSEQQGQPKEEDLACWGHHTSVQSVPDQCMQYAGEDDVSFVFSCRVDGRPVPPDPDLKGPAVKPAKNIDIYKRKLIDTAPSCPKNKEPRTMQENREANTPPVKVAKKHSNDSPPVTEQDQKQSRYETLLISDSDDDFI